MADNNTNTGNRFTRSLLDDSPVLEAERGDLLIFAPTAEVLAEAATETLQPLTIGIFGEWGVGKTSMMRLIKDKVEKNENAAAVWFNAWQYEKEEHLILPLVATIITELSNRKGGWPKCLRKGVRNVKNALRAIVYSSTAEGEAKVPILKKLKIKFSGKDMVQRYEELSKSATLLRSLYFDAFEELKQCKERACVCKAPRIVLFVDDLDRCLPNKAVELLEGIKLVLHQPGFSFVLGVNGKIIEAFVKTKYAKDFNIDGSYFDSYLDKIVQVKYSMPKHETEDMREYITTLLWQVQIFPAAVVGDAVPLIAEACRHNPRSVVRLLNRVLLTHRIGKVGHKEFDPLALLIHIATDEPHYEEFRKALDISIIRVTQEGQEGLDVQAEKAKEIGKHLAEAMGDGDVSDNDTIRSRLRAVRMRSREDEWKQVVETIARSDNLLNLLKSVKGRQWLEDFKLRRKMSKASQSTSEEKKAEAASASAFDSSKPIEVLLKNRVKIPAGRFKMGGDGNKSEQPIHEVTLQAFEIGAMQVTQEQYEAVMGVNPSHFKGPKSPVEQVSWREAMEFCKRLSERTKREFTLPSEAQWEYACRAGSTGSYCFGDDEKELAEYAWYGGNSEGQTHPVGEKKPNDWGLYDMHGNVWEWCLDHWHSNYNGAPDDGNAWVTAEEGPSRVIRGGSWNSGPHSCRSAYRDNNGPDNRFNFVGFRVLAAWRLNGY